MIISICNISYKFVTFIDTFGSFRMIKRPHNFWTKFGNFVYSVTAQLATSNFHAAE